MTAGLFLRARRKLLGFTQEAFAERADCSPETLRRIERGRTVPGPQLALKLAEELQLPPELHATFVAWVRGAELPPARLAPLLALLPTSEPPTTPQSAAPAVLTGDQRDRKHMLEKVRAIWVAEILDKRLAERPRLALRLRERPDAVRDPAHAHLREDAPVAREFDPAATLGAIFDAKRGELLILGEPGAGKSIALLELARELLDRAALDPNHPIPVVFTLSSWSVRRLSLSAWLTEELTAFYDVPQRIAAEWVATHQILPLLDGLDEVPGPQRAACVEAINVFRREYGLIKLAVCSRVPEYTVPGVPLLKLGGAVQIEPLDAQQVDAYLAAAGRTDLLGVLRDDPALLELVRAPLMLALLSELFARDLAGTRTTIASPEQRRSAILSHYATKMLERRGERSRYTPAQIRSYLAWLARAMEQHGQAVFFVEHLHAGWLKDAAARSRYAAAEKLLLGFSVGALTGVIWGFGGGLNQRSIATPAVDYLLGLPARYSGAQVREWLAQVGAISLLLGLATGLAVWLATRAAERIVVARRLPALLADPQKRGAVAAGCAIGALDGVLAGVRNGVAPGGAAAPLLTGLGIGLLVALATGMGAGFVCLRASYPDRIVVVETFKWPRRDLWRWVRLGLVIGALLGLLYGLTVGAADNQLQGLLYGMIAGLWNGLAGGLIAGALVGVGRGAISERAYPNQGIWRSAGTALWLGCLTWLIMALSATASDLLALWATYWSGRQISSLELRYALAWSLIHWSIWALSFGLGAALLNGGLACVQHTIVRALLWRAGALPWHVVRLLDSAAQQIVLQKVGGGYQFRHRLVRDHFATRPAEAFPGATEPAGADGTRA